MINTRISHGLWLDMSFVQRVVCFLSRALARGRKTYNEFDKNHIQPQTMGDSFYRML